MNASPVPEPDAPQRDPSTETADELGVLSDHSQQADPDEVVSQGAQPEAEINPKSRVTAGRHVKHEPASASKRKRHIAQARKESEKVFHRGAPELSKEGKSAKK